MQVVVEAYRRSGKNNGEIQELPRTLSLSEDHQERMCRRLQGAERSLDRGSNPVRKDLWEGTKDNLSPGASDMEATCNHNMGQGRTLERAKDNRRLSSSSRTTRKHSCSDRTLREASDRGSKPIQKEKGRSTNDNRRSLRSGNRPTHLTPMVTISRRAVTTRRNSPKGKGKTH